MEKQRDFIDLLLLSCFDGVFPAMKESGEWIIYLGRKCGHLDEAGEKCTIHMDSDQSLICRSYDSHSCWYRGAFTPKRRRMLLPFCTEGLIRLEKRYKLIENRFKKAVNWDELCDSAGEYGQNTPESEGDVCDFAVPLSLPFNNCRGEQFLFFPPYKRPEYRSHFELISFRLGFPGVYLVMTDSVWAFLVKTTVEHSLLDLIREEYYPAVTYKDGRYSSENIMKEQCPFSGAGKGWVVLRRSDIDVLTRLTDFDQSGRVRRLPSSADLLDVLSSKLPENAE